MSSYVTLLGTEDVTRAASRMECAASEMARAAASIEESNTRQRIFMDDWLQRLEEILKSTK